MTTDLVRLESASFSYATERALTDIDLVVRAGDLIGIVGPSGSGKTTLLKLLTGAVDPTEGAVTWPAGRPRVGYVPQIETIDWYFPVTVHEVIAMGLTDRTGPRLTRREAGAVEEILDRLGLAGLSDRHIRKLSGGQQQRAFLGRALVARPQLLVLDEPTAGVDVATRHDIMHLLHDLHHEGYAVVFTTHDLNGVAAHLQDLVCLNRSVIAKGPPAEILTSAVLERTYGAPMEVLIHGGMPVVIDPAIAPGAGGGRHHEHP